MDGRMEGLRRVNSGGFSLRVSSDFSFELVKGVGIKKGCINATDRKNFLEDVLVVNGETRNVSNNIFMNPNYRILDFSEIVIQKLRAFKLGNLKLIDFWWHNEICSLNSVIYDNSLSMFRFSKFAKYRMLNDNLGLSDCHNLTFDKCFLDSRGSFIGDKFYDLDSLIQSNQIGSRLIKTQILDSELRNNLFENKVILRNYINAFFGLLNSNCCDGNSCYNSNNFEFMDFNLGRFDDVKRGFYQEKLINLDLTTLDLSLKTMNDRARFVCVPLNFK